VKTITKLLKQTNIRVVYKTNNTTERILNIKPKANNTTERILNIKPKTNTITAAFINYSGKHVQKNTLDRQTKPFKRDIQNTYRKLKVTQKMVDSPIIP
jgi:hypothetical protein